MPFAAQLGLTRLSGWVALGIQLEHSRPAHPEDNGVHERMHRDINAEVAAHVQVDAAAQQAALDVWRDEFNRIRGARCFRDTQIFITSALAGWHVGLRIRDAVAVEVWFNYILVGILSCNTKRFDSAPSRSVKALRVAA